MKKAKIMLFAIAVLAIAGGALAFKAKTVNGLKYCTTDGVDGQEPSNFTCPAFIAAVDFNGSPISDPYVFYITTAGDECPQAGSAVNCVGSGYMQHNG